MNVRPLLIEVEISSVNVRFESVPLISPVYGPHHRNRHKRFLRWLKYGRAFLGFLPDIGKFVIASVLLHVLFKMSHRPVLYLG